MRCDELRDILDLYLDDNLSEEAWSRIDRHLLRCAACSYEVRTMEQARNMLKVAVPRAEVTPGFRERAVARLLGELAMHLRPEQEPQGARQWSLDLLRED